MSNERRSHASGLDELLCAALGVGLVLVILVPAARGMSAIGWLPMWLVAMPAAAWWALRWVAAGDGSRSVRELAALPMALPARATLQARRPRLAPPRRGPVRHAA